METPASPETDDTAAVSDEHGANASDLSADYHEAVVNGAQNPDFDVQVHDDNASKESEEEDKKGSTKNASPTKKGKEEDPEETTTPKVLGRRHRQGRLTLRRASVESDSNSSINTAAALPRGYYETVLVRRALDKSEGDPSLGMKLTIMGGLVIVQSLSTLADGRASPAQLSGWIQRGDVLLQINEISLVNLPIDHLMKGLSPLSTIDDSTGKYAPTLRLRLARGQGLRLLQQAEQRQQIDSLNQAGTANQPFPEMDPAIDMFTMFPMGDQLPSVPYPQPSPPQAILSSPEPAAKKEISTESDISTTSALLVPGTLEESIAEKLAEERLYERRQIISDFFSRQAALRLTYHNLQIWTDMEDEVKDSPSTWDLSPAEMMDLGTQALKGAKALSAIMERVDRGSDRRSFHSLTATLSLYSRASTRRRYVLDGRAMPVNFDKVQEATFTEEEGEDGEKDNEHSSVDSAANSDDGEQLDGDELLLQLAATDEIWRKQVLDFLEQVIQQSMEDTSDECTQPNDNIDMSNELGSFLFGTDMHEVLKRQRKSHALPPPEITSLLFDLTTKISSIVPDRIKAEGDPITVRSSLVPFIGMRKPSQDSNIMLANHFLLNQVLPLWLKSFRPLPVEQRRILWPPERSQNMESTAGSTLSGDDNLTLDSMTTKTTGGGSRTRKNLRQQIEDYELDPESRAETRFLTTYYFAQHLLPRLLPQSREATPEQDNDLKEILEFVSQYGAYLKLHTCLAYAAVLEQKRLIDALLEVAKFDPRHRDVMKQTAKPGALVIYDSTMLSAVAQRLKDIRTAKTAERQRSTIDLCYQAYPDLRPWQVKEICVESTGPITIGSENDLADLYYSYLSLLLHPTDGHDGARHDTSLVEEYCALSVKTNGEETTQKKQNFLQVASKTSSNHLAYVRNLPFLLKLSMNAQEYNLALDLAAEVLDTNTDLNSQKSLRVLIGYVTDIGRSGLDSSFLDSEKGSRILKRVLRLYNRLSLLKTEAAKTVINVPVELTMLLEHAELAPNSSKDRVVEIISFFALEAHPENVLDALVRWCLPDDTDSRLYPVYQTILKEGARNSAWIEMSGSLYRVLQAHAKFEDSFVSQREADEEEYVTRPEPSAEEEESLWRKLSHGALHLEK